MAAEISAPILVYEKPRFTEPMFLKAKDGPLQKSNSTPPKPAKGGQAGQLQREDTESSTAVRRSSGILRKVSFRSRSISQGGERSKPASPEKRRSSFGGFLPRRMSNFFGSARENDKKRGGSVTSKSKDREDGLVVFSEE